MLDEIKEDARIHLHTHSSLDRVLLNHHEGLKEEEKKVIEECVKSLEV